MPPEDMQAIRGNLAQALGLWGREDAFHLWARITTGAAFLAVYPGAGSRQLHRMPRFFGLVEPSETNATALIQARPPPEFWEADSSEAHQRPRITRPHRIRAPQTPLRQRRQAITHQTASQVAGKQSQHLDAISPWQNYVISLSQDSGKGSANRKLTDQCEVFERRLVVQGHERLDLLLHFTALVGPRCARIPAPALETPDVQPWQFTTNAHSIKHRPAPWQRPVAGICSFD
jgi:hypothetical protein